MGEAGEKHLLFYEGNLPLLQFTNRTILLEYVMYYYVKIL